MGRNVEEILHWITFAVCFIAAASIFDFESAVAGNLDLDVQLDKFEQFLKLDMPEIAEGSEFLQIDRFRQ